VTVSGGGLSRVLQVDPGATASISGLTITGGSAANGGGMYNDNGTATLTDCTISGNAAASGNPASFNGGGLYNLNGTVKLTNCTVSGNSATDSGGGPGWRHRHDLWQGDDHRLRDRQ
jgi:hypothetical protein